MKHIADQFGDDPDGAAGAEEDSPIVAVGPMWRWQAADPGSPMSWFFMTISGPAVDALKARAPLRGGFGSIKVTAQVGETSWRTSVFPHKESGGFLLPLKASVRKSEGLKEGDVVEVSLQMG